jgi:hypothetical protein
MKPVIYGALVGWAIAAGLGGLLVTVTNDYGGNTWVVWPVGFLLGWVATGAAIRWFDRRDEERRRAQLRAELIRRWES